MSNFKEKYLAGEVTIKDLDDFVDSWHDSKQDISLQDFLGFSDDEYIAFGKGETVIQKILDTQKQKHKSASHLKKVLTELVKE